MGTEFTTLGSIHISPNAVASIVYHAVMETYGVVGLAPKNLAEGLAHSITREPARGVSVHYDGENINIDVYVIVEYGTRIASVAESVANSIRYQVEKTIGIKVTSINVHICGLRVSNSN